MAGEFIRVGRIAGAFGLKGEVKVFDVLPMAWWCRKYRCSARSMISSVPGAY